MSLTPEERRKIYEEENARIEAREHFEREKKSGSTETSTGLTPNIAAMLCYLGGWITGIIFFFIETKNKLIRFHAAQSIIIFAALSIIGTLIKLVPFAGGVLSTLVGIAAFIIWIILLIKAYNGEVIRLGVISEIAENMVNSGTIVQEPPATETKSESAAAADAGTVKEAEKDTPPYTQSAGEHKHDIFPPVNLDKEIGQKIEDYFNRKKSGRIAGSAFAIAFGIAALIFFNYFNEYVAYYTSDMVNGVRVWTMTPFFTNDVNIWLPVFSTAVIVSIAGHVLAIIFDKYLLRELLMIVIDAFSLWSVITLVTVFPFDFTAIPNASVADVVDIAVRIGLIGVCIGTGIAILVKGIKYLTNMAQGHTTYDSISR